MSKQIMTKKRLLEFLKEYNNKLLVKEYLRSLIELEITPFDDVETLKDCSLDSLTREILRYNLMIKAISAVTYDYNPRKYDLVIDKGYDFNISARYKGLNTYNLINIKFDKSVDITLNDRTSLEALLEQKKREYEELEDYFYNTYYIYFGHLNSPEDISDQKRVQDRQKALDSQILRIEELLDVQDLSLLDKSLMEGLSIRPKMDSVIKSDEVYETSLIRNEEKIKVYSRRIAK